MKHVVTLNKMRHFEFEQNKVIVLFLCSFVHFKIILLRVMLGMFLRLWYNFVWKVLTQNRNCLEGLKAITYCTELFCFCIFCILSISLSSSDCEKWTIITNPFIKTQFVLWFILRWLIYFISLFSQKLLWATSNLTLIWTEIVKWSDG